MKKILIILFVYLLGNMQMSGQSLWGNNSWDDLPGLNDPMPMHPIDYQGVCEWGCPCGGGTGSNPGGGGGSVDNSIRLMTYNIHKENYIDNGRLIGRNGDIIAVQEIAGEGKFTKLKQHSLKYGKFLTTRDFIVIKYGIALLWNWSREPITIVTGLIETPNSDHDPRRGYIIAEFDDFIFVSTHYPTGDYSKPDKNKMTDAILGENIIKNSSKPVFVAGDFNCSPHHEEMDKYKYDGFEILNNTEREGEVYEHATTGNGTTKDFIMGKKNSAEYEVIWRGIPEGAGFNLSDHLPYVVKVKINP